MVTLQNYVFHKLCLGIHEKLPLYWEYRWRKISGIFIQEYFPSMIKNLLNPKVRGFFQEGNSSHNRVLAK